MQRLHLRREVVAIGKRNNLGKRERLHVAKRLGAREGIGPPGIMRAILPARIRRHLAGSAQTRVGVCGRAARLSASSSAATGNETKSTSASSEADNAGANEQERSGFRYRCSLCQNVKAETQVVNFQPRAT